MSPTMEDAASHETFAGALPPDALRQTHSVEDDVSARPSRRPHRGAATLTADDELRLLTAARSVC
jgi:hypothetical protein